jgi:peptide/nickel transport system substrate-binding protein
VKQKATRLFAALLAAAVSAGALASCGSTTTDTSSTESAASSASASESESSTEAETTDTSSIPLVYATETFNQKFNPFFYTTAVDGYVSDVCLETLLNTDRAGAIVYSGIEGETRAYNGTDYTYTGLADCTVDEGDDYTTYTFKLREGVQFADGEELTADDLIFSLYVVLDPTYTGITTLYSEDIVGLQNYRTQTTDEIYDKYSDMFDYFYANGDAGEYGDDLYAAYEDELYTTWVNDLQGIVDYVYTNYAGSYASDLDVDEITDDLKVAFGMTEWSFATYADGVVTGADGTTFDIANGEYPTIEDFYNAAVAKYGDAAAYDEAGESANSAVIVDDAKSDFILTYGAQDDSMEGGVTSITGIQKLDDYTVSVTTNGFAATTIYKLAGIYLAPMHYYGDESKYDYEAGSYGFDFGDLSAIEDNLSPMGTGPYVYDGYSNKVAYFSANDLYWKGAPKTKQLQFKETQPSDQIAAIATGSADVTDPESSVAAYDEIKSYNSNGEVNGDTMEIRDYDMQGYGLIGINADTVNVGGDGASEASRNLRKAFATIIAVYRDIAINSYYGEGAKVINYSITSCSWASPQPTDEDYKVAYSVDVNGDPIYTADMTSDEKYAAAIEAAKGFLIAAGYTWDEASGKFTAAPEGAKLEYEAVVLAGGTGTHPDYMLLEYARDALATIGITMSINDPSDNNVLWNALSAGTQEIWCMSWSSGVDPDMYQIWYSTNVPGLPGSTGSNYAHLQDDEMDKLIMDGRSTSDQNYRKAVYKQCLEIIQDWGVEIPIFQRQEFALFSPQRVNMDTVTPDITSYWSWRHDLEKIEMIG